MLILYNLRCVILGRWSWIDIDMGKLLVDEKEVTWRAKLS